MRTITSVVDVAVTAFSALVFRQEIGTPGGPRIALLGVIGLDREDDPPCAR